jgi:hypothetical protein
MASTRNKNTPGNYCLFLKQNEEIETWQLYKNGANGQAYDTRLPGNGLNPGQLPWNTLSHNPVDIETFLFGINSTNLVNPAPQLTPELKCLNTRNLFKRTPVIMPIPQAIPKFQRPFPIS